MGNIALGSVADQSDNTANQKNMPKPITKVKNPANERIENIYRNIENEPLINKIKKLEERYELLMNIPSVELDMEEVENPKLVKEQPKLAPQETKTEQIKLLKELQTDFNQLLKTPYGTLGYLVKSDSETIKKLYGVDSDEDYYQDLEQSRILVSNRKIEQAIVAGGGKRWMSVGSYLYNPTETPNNLKITDHVIYEIINSIAKNLQFLSN